MRHSILAERRDTEHAVPADLTAWCGTRWSLADVTWINITMSRNFDHASARSFRL